MPASQPPAAPRRRRTAEAARSAILDAAERRLVEAGPAGIRLQDVAADVGVSHPTVLHHFGSREGLVQAVVERVQQSIYGLVIEAIERTDLGQGEDAMARLLEQVFEVIAAKGQARVFFWLALTGMPHPDERVPLQAVLETTHALRQRQPGAAPSLEDTRFAVMLATLALTAQSVLGAHLFENVGVGKEDEFQRRFRAWLAKLLVQHFGGG